ncbi:MAG: DUF955 domain-containing protein [Pirellula sp.]|nr:DUF955 domain-containing protein [Pirellula sp.]
MKNMRVGEHEAKDIDTQIAKILRGLGNPEPPLDLAAVRQLLELDKGYYSSSVDAGLLRQTISRLKVAGKQILKNPLVLWDAIKKADLSALYLPSKRLILIDQDKPRLKHRWSEAHEIGHSFIEWHVEMNLGDTDFTLRPECHEVIEAEANYAAGRLLFMQDRFIRESNDSARSIESIKTLAGRYGNTVTSTLWRFVEAADMPLVAMVTQHPRRLNDDFDPLNPCKYCVESERFRSEFGGTTETELFGVLQSYCGHQKGGKLGETEAILCDRNRVRHVFHFESFGNTYDVLTLAKRVREVTAKRFILAQ